MPLVPPVEGLDHNLHMSASAPGIEGLRRRIDAIDDSIHDLLMERGGVVSEIAELKRQGDGVWYRPAREAAVMRRLLARHNGPMPRHSLVRLWREILGAATRQQGDFRVAAMRATDGSGTWEAARDHFGLAVPLDTFATPLLVLSSVIDGKAAVGVLPVPLSEEPQPWWPQLIRHAARGLRVVARLPFVLAQPRDAEAYAVAPADTDATGDDRTLLSIETAEPMSRARVYDVMAEANLRPSLLAGDAQAARAGRSLHLADLPGYLGAEDEALAQLRQAFASVSARVERVGGYATPIGRDA